MAVKRITWRWLFNSFGVIVFIIVVVEVVFAVSIYRFYYNSVNQTLTTQADRINAIFTQYYNENEGNPEPFRGQVRDYVASFPEKERMELMTIDMEGQIAVTSSGFDPDDKRLPDFLEAVQSESRSGVYIGQLGEERVMALCFLTSSTDTSLSAIRLVVSLANVDRQIVLLIAAMAVLGIVVLALVLFSSSYFLSSIVNPVGEVSETARKIAMGDFQVRLEKHTNDEIGELCDTINYMAERLGESEQLKNDFISSVSHELRTPLTAIQGWGETIVDVGSKDPELLNKGMHVIISETGRLSQMVEELLDFSRIQGGRMQLDMSKIDALAELSDVVLMYTERTKRDSIHLVYLENDLIVPVYGDKNKLRQVFVNVVDNGVKYTDPGGTVTVSAWTEGDKLVIEVKDTGIGIAPEDLPRVKEKFYKVSSTRRSSGIGLAVADEIVKLHGGTLELDSQLGEGTTVTITLPVMQQEE